MNSAFLLTLLAVAAEPVDYSRDIKPLLKARCYACHGSLAQKSNLRLDAGALIVKGGKHGPAVKIGDPAASPLVDRVTRNPDEEGGRMPPDGSPLTAEQVGKIKAWIEQGARVPANDKPEPDPREHWAFRPPIRPAQPVVRNAGWVRNPIDAFVAAEQDRRGLTPNGPAAPAVLLRRVYLDLIGVPPTRQELHEVGSSRVDLQACKLEYSIVSPK